MIPNYKALVDRRAVVEGEVIESTTKVKCKVKNMRCEPIIVMLGGRCGNGSRERGYKDTSTDTQQN